MRSIWLLIHTNHLTFRNLKVLGTTITQRRDLFHCSLQHVSLDDVTPESKAFLDEMELRTGLPVTSHYATTRWMLKHAEASESEPVAVRQQDLEISDDLHLHTQPRIAIGDMQQRSNC
jgi:hypothetical protein